MLVLSVHENERIMVGDNIVITLVRNKGQQGARIGIDAPKDIAIDREKIYLAKRATKQIQDEIPSEISLVDGRYWYTMDEVSYGPFTLEEAIKQLGDYKTFMGIK